MNVLLAVLAAPVLFLHWLFMGKTFGHAKAIAFL